VTILEETNHFPIIGGWVYQDCWVRLADGSVDLYSIPLRPLGGLK
jgi:hypothetical protein